MEELADNGEPLDKNSRWKENISQLLIAFFIITNQYFYEYFFPWVNAYVFYLICALVFFVIYQLINKKKNQPFDFKSIAKDLGLIVLAMLVYYNVMNLMVSVSAAVPENIAALFPVFLIIGIVIFLIGYGFYYIEKHSKP